MNIFFLHKMTFLYRLFHRRLRDDSNESQLGMFRINRSPRNRINERGTRTSVTLARASVRFQITLSRYWMNLDPSTWGSFDSAKAFLEVKREEKPNKKKFFFKKWKTVSFSLINVFNDNVNTVKITSRLHGR